MRKLQVNTEYITLGQMLKLADFVQSGGEVKWFLEERAITVNGEPDDRRGRKLRPGDVVQVEGEEPVTLTAGDA